MEYKESYNVEFKEKISKNFLKTVVAYANYNDGKIIFGIDDKGNVLGLYNIKDDTLRIENMINDSIFPIPNFEIEYKKIHNKSIISLNVKKGKDTPYLYKGKAYKRAGTSTVEVDRFEYRRLSIEGINMDYEERKASIQDLNFAILESKLKEEAGIEKMDLDILRTLNLYNKDEYYNIAAELLADKNNIDFSGIDIVKFGKNINSILYRKTISKKSLLSQYDKAIEIFEQYYIFEEVDGYNRIIKELIPKKAFRESLANAIVHRVWDTRSFIQIAMYEGRIEISSPGGLPEGISEQEYLYGNISVLRNPIIASVFHRLNIIEKFGTGIARINDEYINSLAKPDFDITQNRIRIVLPITDNRELNLSKNQLLVLNIIKEEGEISRKQLDLLTGFEKSKTIRKLNALLNKNIIVKIGSGNSIKYKLR